jgi:hypothetical protein
MKRNHDQLAHAAEIVADIIKNTDGDQRYVLYEVIAVELMNTEQPVKSCGNCKHYSCVRQEESWEMPHVFWYERECDVRSGVSNLKSFPFNNTKCEKFEAKNEP